jgi:very-short-patch-repair endonuclease
MAACASRWRNRPAQRDLTWFLPAQRGRCRAKRGGGGMRAPERTIRRARDLRHEMTLPEIVLWRALRKGALPGLRFRRQHPVGPYVLDFYCPTARLAVEVDGMAHDNAAQVRHDQRRQEWLANKGVRVLRIRASDVLRDEALEGVLRIIEQSAAPSGSLRSPPPPLRRGGTHL